MPSAVYAVILYLRRLKGFWICLCSDLPCNVLSHYNKHLLRYFEFLPGSMIICLPLNISEKLNWQHLFEKLEKAETHRLHLCQHDTIPIHPDEHYYHSNKPGLPPFFHLDTNLVLGHILLHPVDKTHVLVVTVELFCLLFLKILSFNFVLRLPAIALTNDCQS